VIVFSAKLSQLQSLQDRVYQKHVRNIGKLKQRLVKAWADFIQTIVDDVSNEWRKWLGMWA